MNKGKTIGYIRVSSVDQNTDRQLEQIKTDRLFIDRASGKNKNRPELENMIQYVRDGDTVIVHSMDRLARNLDDLRKIVKTLNEKDVKVQFLKENLTFTGDDAPMSNLLLSVMGAFAEFERAIIKERQMEGISIAKQKGIYKGRKKRLSAEQILEIKSKVTKGEKKSHIAREYGISREALYRYLRNEMDSPPLSD